MELLLERSSPAISKDTRRGLWRLKQFPGHANEVSTAITRGLVAGRSAAAVILGAAGKDREYARMNYCISGVVGGGSSGHA